MNTVLDELILNTARSNSYRRDRPVDSPCVPLALQRRSGVRVGLRGASRLQREVAGRNGAYDFWQSVDTGPLSTREPPHDIHCHWNLGIMCMLGEKHLNERKLYFPLVWRFTPGAKWRGWFQA